MGATIQQVIDNYLHTELIRIFRDGPGLNHVIKRHLNISEQDLINRMSVEKTLYQSTFLCDDAESFRKAFYAELTNWETGLAYYILKGNREPLKIAIENPFRSFGIKRDCIGGKIETVEELPYILLCIGKREDRNFPVIYTAYPVTEEVAKPYL